MKIGISITSAHRVDDVREGARRMINRARAARAAGLDSLFVGDQHVTAIPYYQNTPMMGRLLAEWNDNVSGALYLLPLWNPVILAEQIATLASIAEGRFVMQCGIGAGDRQFAGTGANIKTRPSAFEESLDIMRALWAGETVSSSGRFKIDGARISPQPPEPIEVWIGADAPVAIDRAARMGDVFLASPGLGHDAAKDKLDVYLAALDRHKKAVPETIALRRDIYVAQSPDDADAAREASGGYRGIDPNALMIGTAAEVAAEMQSYGELGYTDIIIRNLHPDPDKAVASIERLADVKKILAG